MTVIDLRRVLNHRKLYLAEKSLGGKTTKHRKKREIPIQYKKYRKFMPLR